MHQKSSRAHVHAQAARQPVNESCHTGPLGLPYLTKCHAGQARQWPGGWGCVTQHLSWGQASCAYPSAASATPTKTEGSREAALGDPVWGEVLPC